MNEGYESSTVKFPNGWLNCPNFGLRVQDLFIPFKTPLDKKFNTFVPQAKRFNILSVKNMIKKNDIHLVVNLTVENDFYNPREFLGLNQLKLIKDKRQRFPNDDEIIKFTRYVQDMLNKFPKGRVGVHCIHGYNKTGFLIIAYLVIVQNIKLELAVKLFADARPPGIYREEFIEELKSRYDPDVDIPVPNFPDWYTETKKGKKSRHRDEAYVMETAPSLLSHPLERASVITSTRKIEERPLIPSEINEYAEEEKAQTDAMPTEKERSSKDKRSRDLSPKTNYLNKLDEGYESDKSKVSSRGSTARYSSPLKIKEKPQEYQEDDLDQVSSLEKKEEPDEYPEEFFEEVAPPQSPVLAIMARVTDEENEKSGNVQATLELKGDEQNTEFTDNQRSGLAAPGASYYLDPENQSTITRKRKAPKIYKRIRINKENYSERIENKKFFEEKMMKVAFVKTLLTADQEKFKLKQKHEFIIKSDKVVEVTDRQLRKTLSKRIRTILKTSRKGYVGPKYVQLTRKTLNEFLETKNDLFHTWITDGRRYMLYIGKRSEVYFIDENNIYFAVTGISFPHYHDPSRQLTETIFDGEFVIDRIGDSNVNIYLISHVFAIEGKIVPEQNIFQRFGLIEGITLHPRSTIPLHELSKEPFSIGIKKIMPLNQMDYVWNVLRNNLPHGMPGLVFYPLMSTAYSDVETNYLFLWQPPDMILVDFKAVKALNETTREMVLELYLEGSEKPYTKLEKLEHFILDLYDQSIVQARRGADKKWHIVGYKIGGKVATSTSDIKDIIEEMNHPLTFTDLLEKI